MSHANTTISARQLIYTNVEAKQSPHKGSGFQILLASQGINERDKINLAERLVYSLPSKDDAPTKENTPTKHVFCATSSGDLLVAQIVSLPEPDAAGRFGRYFAHALIFSPAEFEELNNDPFPIFHSFDFLVTVEAALERGNRLTGEIATEVRSAAEWSRTDLKFNLARTRILDEMDSQNRRQLLLISNQLVSNEGESKSLGLFGEPTVAFQYLSALVAVTPKSLRPRCSFDTFATGGGLKSVYYWAVGLPAEAVRPPRFFALNLAQRRLESAILPPPTTTYQKWLDEQHRRPTADIAEESDTAAQFMAWLENPEMRLAPPQNQAESSVWMSLANLNINAIKKRLHNRLTQQTGEFLAPLLAPQLISPLLSQHSIVNAIKVCQQGFMLDQLKEAVWMLCANLKDNLNPDVLSDIEWFANANDLNQVKLAVLRMTRQWERLSNALQQASDDDYQFFANWALESLPIRLQWNVEHKGDSLSFGPHLKVLSPDKSVFEADFCPLLYALLGKTLPEQTSWFSPTRRRHENAPTPPNTKRWFWLMEELEKRQSKRAEQTRSSVPFSTRSMTPNPPKR